MGWGKETVNLVVRKNKRNERGETIVTAVPAHPTVSEGQQVSVSSPEGCRVADVCPSALRAV